MIKVYCLDGNNPHWNLLYEKYYLEKQKKNSQDIYIFFYENRNSVILGKNQKEKDEVFIYKNIEIVKRISGGGAVCHFKGNLNYGVLISTEYYPYLKEINNSYKIIMNIVSSAMQNIIPNIQQHGTSDLSIAYNQQNWKISGNAQARKKNWLLHHGTIIYNTQYANIIPFFLKEPLKQPEYRKKRKHKQFVIQCLPPIKKSYIMSLILKECSIYFQKDIIFQHINQYKIWQIIQQEI